MYYNVICILRYDNFIGKIINESFFYSTIIYELFFRYSNVLFDEKLR
jgi:hypothetical protein